MMTKPTHGTVYRAFAADGTLLYVGMSTRLRSRLRQHQKHSAWWSLHARIEYDAPLPLNHAFRSEADQITLLRPVFNKLAGVVDRFGPDRSTEREWLEWKRQYEGGATIEGIALEAHAGPHTVRKHLVALGTEMRRSGQRAGTSRRRAANARPSERPSEPVVHVAFGGSRSTHRRRGGRFAA